MITFKLENGVVFTLRTSGTEPKIKFYSEAQGPDFEAVTKELKRTIAEMVKELLQPALNHLEAQSD